MWMGWRGKRPSCCLMKAPGGKTSYWWHHDGLGNVPQEGLLFGAFASKHSWGWCRHYAQLLLVAVICVILLECNTTPWGDEESADVQKWAGQEFSLRKRKRTITRSQLRGVWWIPPQCFFLCSIPIYIAIITVQKHGNDAMQRFTSHWCQCLICPAFYENG